MKTFAEKLADLIGEELTLPGNPDAATDNVISALEIQASALKEELKADRAERAKFQAGR